MILSPHRYCRGCVEKQRALDQLRAEVQRLRAKLRYQERTAREGFFGSATPSAQVPVKPNSLAERQARRGGARPGHAGHGRHAVASEAADRCTRIQAPCRCPGCGGPLRPRKWRRRTVLDSQPVKVDRVVFQVEVRQCARCGRRVTATAPGVLPRSLYGNQLLTWVAVQHYLYGQTLGQLEQQTGLACGSLIQALHGLARRLQPLVPRLIRAYRRAPVKHADETGWRTDGQNGYAWLFATPRLSLFRFRASRSAAVAREVLGPRRLPGVLVVDRYAAYNRLRVALQYCYAHLLREVQDLEKEFPDTPEVCAFVAALAPLLAAAMALRNLPGTARQFRRQARLLRCQILRVIAARARHPGIQKIQTLFREHTARLYHWARDRQIPADNNLAERDLRPLVIARKVSFGSQSVAGAQTRETLMTILFSLRKQAPNVAARFKQALDRLAQNPAQNPYPLFFPPDSS